MSCGLLWRLHKDHVVGKLVILGYKSQKFFFAICDLVCDLLQIALLLLLRVLACVFARIYLDVFLNLCTFARRFCRPLVVGLAAYQTVTSLTKSLAINFPE